MDRFNEILDRTYYDNTVQQYLIALGIIVGVILLINLFKRSILSRVEKLTMKTKTKVDGFIVSKFDKYGIPALYILTVYFGLSYLKFPDRIENILHIALTFALTILAIRLVSSVAQAMLKYYLRHQENGDERVKQLSGLMFLINIFIWGIGILFLFSNLGFDVTAVIAGMGIGGIAIALAAQNILGDLFNYFVILFDRPFEVGDFLVIDEKAGSIEKIGIKTTRIRSLTGEQLIFSNGDLMGSRIHNYKRMQRRRIAFTVGITYQTSLEQLKKIPDLIRTIIESTDLLTFDRSHFKQFSDSSLDYETVYFVEVPDFNIYMDKQQHINFRIVEEFEKLGIEMAFPTRTLYLNMENNETKSQLIPKK